MYNPGQREDFTGASAGFGGTAATPVGGVHVERAAPIMGDGEATTTIALVAGAELEAHATFSLTGTVDVFDSRRNPSKEQGYPRDDKITSSPAASPRDHGKDRAPSVGPRGADNNGTTGTGRSSSQDRMNYTPADGCGVIMSC